MGFCTIEEKEKLVNKHIDEIDEKLDAMYQKAIRFNDVIDEIADLQDSLKHIRAANSLKVGELK